MRDAIDAVPFPQFQGRTPPVRFGDADPSLGAEVIGIATNLERQQIEWVRLGPAGRDEVLAFDVVHRIMNPNVKAPDLLWDRMEEIADLIQSALYDTTTESTKLLGFTGEVNMHRVDGVNPVLAPSGDGWVGVCTTALLLRARF